MVADACTFSPMELWCPRKEDQEFEEIEEFGLPGILSQTRTDTPPPHYRQKKNKERMKKLMISISEADHCSISNDWGGDVAMMSEGHFLLICLLRLLEFCLYFLTRVFTGFPVSLFSH